MKYWALKTRKSQNERQKLIDQWDNFMAESVIAIGWEKIDVAPDKASMDKIAAGIKKAYSGSDKSAATSAITIQKFVSISTGDKVLVCQGYAPNQHKKVVHVYGIATVTGLFEDHASKGWQWRFRHEAKIEPFRPSGKYVSKEFLAQRLGKGSLLQTLHEISKEGFERVVEDLSKS